LERAPGERINDLVLIPDGFSTVTPYFVTRNADGLVDFLVAALGGKEIGRTLRPDGKIGNAQVVVGSSTVMIGECSEKYPPMPGSFYLYVSDADASVAQALKHGATLEMSVADMPYGDRQGGICDPFGNLWWISQRLEEGPYY
jgi:PhnB protein